MAQNPAWSGLLLLRSCHAPEAECCGDGGKPEEEAAEKVRCWPETAGVSFPSKQTGRGSIQKFSCCSSVAAVAAAADDGGGDGGRMWREPA